MTFTSVRELGLSNCRLHLPTIKIDAIPPVESYECRSIVVLKAAGAQVCVISKNYYIATKTENIMYLIFIYKTGDSSR